MKSNLKTADNTLQRFGAQTELSDFFIGQRYIDLVSYTVSANQIQGAQAHIVDAVFAVHHGGNGHRGIDTAENALADVAHRNRNGVEGGAFPGDNPAAGLDRKSVV